MPLDPHTWDSDFLTATLLDGNLYMSNGQYFAAEGIRFHARRPIYKAYSMAATSNSTTNGNWCNAFAGSGNIDSAASVIIDSAGLLGAWFDPFTSGNIRLGGLINGGGGLLSPGGLALMTGYGLWPTIGGGTNNVGCGIGLSTGAPGAPSNHGTLQATNTSHQTCCLCIDLVDSNSQRWALFGFNGSGGTTAPSLTAQADGSGWANRLHAHWVSVYPSAGHTVSAAPQPAFSWNNVGVLTSVFFNGNTGLRDVLRFFNMPPLARADNSGSGSQALASGTATTITLSATSGMVSYPGSFASNTYTVPFGGLYFVHGYVAAQNFSGILKAGVNINSTTTFWGPKTPMPGGGEAAATKTQIFSLNAGDTITLKALASAAANTSTAHPARLVVVYVGAQGVPSQVGAPTPHQPIPPDTTFRWTAGQTGPQSDFFNNHVANDLIFLTQRPYFLGYQATGGQAITPSSPTGINLGTVAGIVHNDNGDNYSGWNIGTNKYVAPVSGWYMAVEEIFLAQPTLTSTPSVVALLGLTPGGADWDRYQQQNMITSGEGSGATAVSYYYLRAGDSIQAGVETYDSTSTTINTSTVENSHMELVWLGE